MCGMGMKHGQHIWNPSDWQLSGSDLAKSTRACCLCADASVLPVFF